MCVQYLNRLFAADDIDENHVMTRYLPIDPADGGHDILEKLVDGVLLAKMVNVAVPGTIDERVLHFRDKKSDSIRPKFIVENLNIVMASCKAIGISFRNYRGKKKGDGKEADSDNISVEKLLDPSHYEDIVRFESHEIYREISEIHFCDGMFAVKW